MAAPRSPKDTFITVYGRMPVLEALDDTALRVDKVILAEDLRGEPVRAILSAARARGERETHELRFDVYCREKGWLDPMGFLDRRDTDVDDASAHRSGARLVLCAARRGG